MSLEHDCTPLGRCGVVLYGADSAGLEQIPDERVVALFREHGLVLCRDFRPGRGDFADFARRFTKSHFIGYGKAPFPEHRTITMANDTGVELEAHCDNGIRPEAQRPDITWFLCETPAAEGGETTVFDGIAVWKALSESTRKLFLEKQLIYLTNYPEQVYTKMGCADPQAFEVFVKTIGGALRGVRADRSVDVELLSSAVRRPRFVEEYAFVASLCLAGTRGFEGMRVELEGGQALPAAVLSEVRAALADCRELIRWQTGDVVMLDNSRFLHGRRAYSDMRRTIYLVQTLRANF